MGGSEANQDGREGMGKAVIKCPVFGKDGRGGRTFTISGGGGGCLVSGHSTDPIFSTGSRTFFLFFFFCFFNLGF